MFFFLSNKRNYQNTFADYQVEEKWIIIFKFVLLLLEMLKEQITINTINKFLGYYSNTINSSYLINFREHIGEKPIPSASLRGGTLGNLCLRKHMGNRRVYASKSRNLLVRFKNTSFLSE